MESSRETGQQKKSVKQYKPFGEETIEFRRFVSLREINNFPMRINEKCTS